MTDVIMPQMGESIAEGTITKWLKKSGDKVERDEPLLEISTDKVDSEIPAPVSGVLSEIKVQEGETVSINTVIAIIHSDAAGDPTTTTEAARTTASVETVIVNPPSNLETDRQINLRSSPLVRKMALEHDVDISKISGTGRGNRVRKQDVMAYLERRPETEVQNWKIATQVENMDLPSHDREGLDVDVELMSTMRKSIAEHMLVSRKTSAHVTTVFEADASIVTMMVQEHKGLFKRDGVRITYTPFFVRAVAGALRSFPILNASLDGERIIRHQDINIGVAVALEGGLIVPVIRKADEKSFLGLARSINDMSERARSKKLLPEEVLGGTFTITNPGVFGGLFGTPIINQPQVAILGVGGIHKRPVVVNDGIAVRSMLYLALSFDHRLIDGAVADQFMADVKKRIETWNEKIL